MSFPRYPEYKDSGVEWLGQVPASWSLGKFRHYFSESSEKIESEVYGEMLSVSGYRGIEPKQYGDENQKRTEENLIGYRIVHAGQLVVNTMWLNYAGLGVSQLEGHVSPAYRSYWVDPSLRKPYVHHLMRSSCYVLGYTKHLTGVRPNSLQMGRDDLMSFPILIPPLPEQESIANFLDQETAKIDALVAEQQKLIELLKEKRQAVISHAVTKGLDPTVKMKDSGVEWLGEVPEHWEVKPIQWVASINDEVLPESIDGDYEIEYVDIGSVNLSSGIESSEMHKFKDAPSRARRIVKNGDVIVSTVRTYLKAIASVKEPPENMIVSTGFAVIRSKRSLEPNFAKFGLQSSYFIDEVISRSTGISYPAINASELAKIKIPLPLAEEQIVIFEYLNEQTLEIDSLISESQKIIVLSQERRSALISAAVTGQIDVRNYQPNLAA